MTYFQFRIARRAWLDDAQDYHKADEDHDTKGWTPEEDEMPYSFLSLEDPDDLEVWNYDNRHNHDTD